MRSVPHASEAGFTLIELLACMAVLSILAVTALSSFRTLTYKAYDATAQTDYRNLKVAIYNVLAVPGTPANIVLTNQRGPRILPAPLEAVSLSSGTIANITCTTVLATGRTPRITVRFDLQHLQGSKIYRYTEVNNVITEQVTAKP